MIITLKPGEMLSGIRGIQSKPMIVEFRTDWDYGHIFVVDDLKHVTKYNVGDKHGFPSKSSINMANGGVKDMEVEIITVW